MTAKPQEQDALKSLLIARWEETGAKIRQLAEAMPEEKFEIRPVSTVRTFGDVLRHVAFWNQYVAAVLQGEPADDQLNELPRAEYTTKARVLEVLKQSSVQAGDALKASAAPLDQKKIELVITFVEHTSEHYGQLVVYRRLAE